jgi:hypothetical protein
MAETDTPGTSALCASVTVPLMLACGDCAGTEKVTRTRTANRKKVRPMVKNLQLSRSGYHVPNLDLPWFFEV